MQVLSLENPIYNVAKFLGVSLQSSDKSLILSYYSEVA